MTNLPVLICKNIWYYSDVDEELFFAWIDKIPFIIKSDGIRDELHLHLKNVILPDETLKELIAFFYRYKIDMKQLAQFLSPENEGWFYSNKKAFWHRRVFGNEKKIA